MSKMLRLELVGIVLLACTQILTEHRDFYGPYNQFGHQRSGPRQQDWDDGIMTKEVEVKEGKLRGMVRKPTTNQRLQLVDVFLGVPYAEPPVDSLRFSPPKSPRPWRYVRRAEEFAPVCPQNLPDLRLEVEPGRHEYLEKLLPYLRNQSEDCLYLNIYAPHQVDGNPRRYPVMVFIQGESFEWNSGNPYDGTVISAYGNVVFVTINFRLGILGFLKPGIGDNVASNFGLLDQTAALVWLRDNIAKFGGDPDSMTLVGHGTGAIFANLLLISPVANNKDLFRRAILMSGSALSSDAIGKAPLQFTQQVAHALNCPTDDDNNLAACLRQRDLKSLLQVKIAKPRFVPSYAPIIDPAVIPRMPLTVMQNSFANAESLGSFDLMYGVTESEKYHLLSPIEALHGMLDQERDNVLKEHLQLTHDGYNIDRTLNKILGHYGDFKEGFTGEYTVKNRDLALKVLSDSGTVAPLMLVADIHSRVNPKSYMYVFSHRKALQDYTKQQSRQTVHGDEIPYVLGEPLNAGRYHFLNDRYNIDEILFSEAMMTWWCNFAHTGNPNAPRRLTYMTDSPREWMQYEVDWPEYSDVNRSYFNLTIPPNVGTNYRADDMRFWNNEMPNLIRPEGSKLPIFDYPEGMGNYSIESRPGYKSSPPTVRQDLHVTFPPPATVKTPVSDVRNDTIDTENGTVRGSSAITMVIGFGVVFLLINVTAFFYLYHRRHSLKSEEKKLRRRISTKKDEDPTKKTKTLKHKQQRVDNVEMGQKSDSKPDINEVIKNDKAYDNNSNFGRRSKLSRQNSSSTIDTHIKVKEWIQQEIVHRCSPRFLRKTRETLQKEHQDRLTKQQQIEEDEERKRFDEEKLRDVTAAPTYEENPALIVRPGKKSKPPKVSVAIDATPATRTESILNQIPIELVKNMEMMNDLGGYDTDMERPLAKPQIVVIEHHHSRSDPLPMENVFKCVKPNFSTTRIYESDSGSASSLYAKINPKLKTRLPRPGQETTPEGAGADSNRPIQETLNEDIYGQGINKLTTFGANEPVADINVTCREPTTDRQVISPEEALKTIKRRNYPKVLPDIEKRRSLPAPNSLYVPRLYGTLSKDHRHGPGNASTTGQPPPPPPRMFGTSKSLDLAEEVEDREPITTNLHVGPLLKRQDSGTGNNSDPNLIDSLERVAIDAQEVLSNHRVEYPDNLGSGGITTNPKCPLHGGGFGFDQGIAEASTSQSVDCLDRNLGNPNWYRNKESQSVGTKTAANSSLPNIVGNPNWYKPVINKKDKDGEPPPDILSTPLRSNLDVERTNEFKHPAEPKIVITPRVGNLLGQSGQNLSQAASGLTVPKDVPEEPRIVITPRTGVVDHPHPGARGKLNDGHQIPSSPVDPPAKGTTTFFNPSHVPKDDRPEPRIIITPKEVKNPPGGSNLKQPKIIIKPTAVPTKNRDQRNIPKVPAIPSPEAQNYQNFEKDTKGPEQPNEAILRLEKPPLKEKPKVTRIPSFSRRKDDRSGNNAKPTDQQTDAGHRAHALPSNQEKSNIPSLSKKESDSSTSTSTSSNSNTNTIKRKPTIKK
ncbi:uncharacterized protein [Venturia canescens]|uniref:uncharacterized protein n=1 Tax=Venturia canescens TaxID=32260 RepID=UPI001C9BD2DA|nr:uncharacterized protein LOC122415985 [Venturia canescens]XP_043284550.1 uncharacterized protein LOC122415985 [Venturia canescens]XP_043284551.1 uncharacterized protein LOC122415985 [Venturia canescens]XP_043284552.1 uncharacterized protein LOC122415985 [Venturia canescens]